MEFSLFNFHNTTAAPVPYTQSLLIYFSIFQYFHFLIVLSFVFSLSQNRSKREAGDVKWKSKFGEFQLSRAESLSHEDVSVTSLFPLTL